MKSDNLRDQLQKVTHDVLKYRVVLFIGLLVVIYGFIAFRIQTLSSAKPSASDNQQATSTAPHFDPQTISKINQLQDNSVNVKALFNEVRKNPFHE